MRTSGAEQPACIPIPDPAPGRESEESQAGLVLEGIFTPGGREGEAERGAVMAPPHPQYGGSMENPVVWEIADACRRAGLASLRFNWRGVGASGGVQTGSPQVAIADYSAALAFALESSAGSIVACGYSFGAASAVNAVGGHERVKALLLVAPPMVMLDRAALTSFPGPILLVAGDRDEYAPRSELEALAKQFDRAEFVLLEGVDHYFTKGLSELGSAAESFLQRIPSG